jgi:serine/threonine protein kinase
MASAYKYFNSFGIIHRDIKLENILVTSQGDDAQLKISDFGLSKILGPGETCKDPFGTMSYVAPEVLLSKPYNKACDIWSMGVVVYVLLSGLMPFEGDN